MFVSDLLPPASAVVAALLLLLLLLLLLCRRCTLAHLLPLPLPLLPTQDEVIPGTTHLLAMERPTAVIEHALAAVAAWQRGLAL